MRRLFFRTGHHPTIQLVYVMMMTLVIKMTLNMVMADDSRVEENYDDDDGEATDVGVTAV